MMAAAEFLDKILATPLATKVLYEHESHTVVAEPENAEKIDRWIASGKEIVVYPGGSIWAVSVVEALDQMGGRLSLSDSDPKKWGQFVAGREIQNFRDIYKSNPDVRVAICSGSSGSAIRRQLQEYLDADKMADVDVFPDVEEYRRFVENNRKQIVSIANRLADKPSKETYLNYIAARILLDKSAFSALYEQDQYFVNGIMDLRDDEVFMDCGAYDGDTINEFIQRTGKIFRKIYGFEPDRENYAKLSDYVRSLDDDRVEIFNKGVFSSKATFSSNPANLGTSSSCISEDADFVGGIIEVDALDAMLESSVPPTLIKMDIEGAEKEALLGGKESISRYRPKLAICAYHKPEDILELPGGINPDYRIYFRHHTIGPNELVMYCR